MKKRNNILPHKTLSRLPQESGFYSGDCPGAAVITIFFSLFSSFRGTLGRKSEAGSGKREARSFSGTPVSDFSSESRPGRENESPKFEAESSCFLTCNSNFLAPLSPFIKGDESWPLVAGKEGVEVPKQTETGRERISLSAGQAGKVKSGRNVPVLLSVLRVGLFCRLAANPDGAGSSVRVGTPEKPEMVLIEGRNIQYRMFKIQFSAENQQPLDGTRNSKPGTCWSEAETPIPRGNLKPETDKENKEHRIRNNESESISENPEPGTRNLKLETCNLTPIAIGAATSNMQQTTITTTPKYKVAPLLPRGRFYSGDYPGAAAITIFFSLFSSPRVSPNFAGAMRLAVPQMGTLRANRLARLSILPVPDPDIYRDYRENQQASHQGSIVPLFRGTSPEYSGRRGYLPFHRNLMFGALNQKGGTPMS